MNSTEPEICKGGSGTLLPAFNPQGEGDWPSWWKIILYTVALFWSFAGVGIITDVFMAAIEEITSKTKILKDEDGRQIVVKVWNPTIANLSLMALGSSAPEIILSIIEIAAGGFFAGELGPSTIVGSAAFNLLVIIAVCLVAIPKGETRRLESLGVFVVTAVFSVIAYIWLIIILIVVTPDIIDLWEAIVTLLLFPVLLVLSFGADKGWFDRKRDHRVSSEEGQVVDIQVGEKHAHFTPFETAAMLRGLPRDIDPREAADIVATQQLTLDPPSRAMFRINATRALTGSRRVLPKVEQAKHTMQAAERRDSFYVKNKTFLKEQNTVGFSSVAYSVPEHCRFAQVTVNRTGDLSKSARVSYRTQDVTATAGEDYIPQEGVLFFQPEQSEAIISIQIIDDEEEEDDEHFIVVLFNPEPSDGLTVIRERSIAQVTIIDNDRPGVICFANEDVRFIESVGDAMIKVIRKEGSKGRVSVKYFTRDGDAHAPLDYQETTGTLVFEDNELEKFISIPIIDDEEYEKDEHFFLVLEEAQGGASLGSPSQVKVTILNDDAKTTLAERVTSILNINRDKFRIGSANWTQQFVDAVTWPDAEEGWLAAFMHIATLPWKLIGACIPPIMFGGGWVAFSVALIFIGLITALIGDLASLMGCSMGLKSSVTAITFVALGTSLPDTFASKSAAVASRTADAAVTNVTGSNSVNVFLGLGLSWTIAAIYWAAAGRTSEWMKEIPLSVQLANPGKSAFFYVPAGSLAFSVIVFSLTCVVCIATLMVRRSVYGAELGGPRSASTAAFFVVLWLLYVVLSSLNAYGHIPNIE